MKEVKRKSQGNCTVCSHESRAGIEMLCCISAATWGIAQKRVNNTFGTDFSIKTLKNHMLNHELSQNAMETGVIIDSIRGEDGAPGIISAETMLQTLLVQGMLDLAKGKIRCKSPDELLRVINMLQQVQDRKSARMLMEEGDIAGFYAAMAAYGTAIRDTVSPQQLVEIVTKANALGAHFDISNARYEEATEVEVQDVMQLAVEDRKRLGRSRTREELVESGALDGISFDGVDLPD